MRQRAESVRYLFAGLGAPAPRRLIHRKGHQIPHRQFLARPAHGSNASGRLLAPAALRRVRFRLARARPDSLTVTGRSELFQGIVSDSLLHMLYGLAGKCAHGVVFDIPAQGSSDRASG